MAWKKSKKGKEGVVTRQVGRRFANEDRGKSCIGSEMVGWVKVRSGGILLEGPGDDDSVGGLETSRKGRDAAGKTAPRVRSGKGVKLLRKEEGAT